MPTPENQIRSLSFAALLGVSVVGAVLAGSAVAQAIEDAKAPTPPAEPGLVAPPGNNPVPTSMPAIRRNVARLAGENPPYPRAAIRAGISEGKVVARVMIDEMGNVSEVIIVGAEPPKYFDQVVIDTLKKWKFRADGTKYVTEVENKFKLNLN